MVADSCRYSPLLSSLLTDLCHHNHDHLIPASLSLCCHHLGAIVSRGFDSQSSTTAAIVIITTTIRCLMTSTSVVCCLHSVANCFLEICDTGSPSFVPPWRVFFVAKNCDFCDSLAGSCESCLSQISPWNLRQYKYMTGGRFCRGFFIFFCDDLGVLLVGVHATNV